MKLRVFPLFVDPENEKFSTILACSTVFFAFFMEKRKPNGAIAHDFEISFCDSPY